MGDKRTAIRNLRKANEAKLQKKDGIKQADPVTKERDQRTAADLDELLKRAQDGLRKKGSLEDENVNYLTNLIKVLSQEKRALQDREGESGRQFETREEAAQAITGVVGEINALLKQLPPGSREKLRKKILPAMDDPEHGPECDRGDSGHLRGH